MSFFVVARVKTMFFNKPQKKIKRNWGNVVAMLIVHNLQSISERIFNARSDALLDSNVVVHYVGTMYWVLCEDRHSQGNAINHFTKTVNSSAHLQYHQKNRILQNIHQCCLQESIDVDVQSAETIVDFLPTNSGNYVCLTAQYCEMLLHH